MNSVAAPAAREPTVYVVDDDPGVRKSLRWLMESVGLKVQCYSSGKEFLSDYQPNCVGCLVLDVRMPGMSGLELHERLRAQGARLPVIMITAYGDVPLAVRAMKGGAVHFFEKPVSDQLLLEQVREVLAEEARRHADTQDVRNVEQRFSRLTPREVEVLHKVVDGLSSKEIGRVLGVSYKTVEAHRAKIMSKMEAGSVPHLIRQYLSLEPQRRVFARENRRGPAPAE
jgi:FixJ family two-component response regulator